MGPGLIAVIAQENSRFTAFSVAMDQMQVPPGSMREWYIGHDIPENHNLAVQTLLQEQHLEWLFLMGDDHVFEPDLLLRLLSHDCHLVAPLCLTRMPPYRPVAFVLDDEGVRERLDLQKAPTSGLIEVLHVGGAGLLVKRHVFEQMSDPWFEYGKLDPTLISEDLYFCDKARAAGYDIWLDTQALLGHCVTGAVWPVPDGDRWTYGFSFSGGMSVAMPSLYVEEAHV